MKDWLIKKLGGFALSEMKREQRLNLDLAFQVSDLKVKLSDVRNIMNSLDYLKMSLQQDIEKSSVLLKLPSGKIIEIPNTEFIERTDYEKEDKTHE